jgi:hypothetical protein
MNLIEIIVLVLVFTVFLPLWFICMLLMLLSASGTWRKGESLGDLWRLIRTPLK